MVRAPVHHVSGPYGPGIYVAEDPVRLSLPLAAFRAFRLWCSHIRRTSSRSFYLSAVNPAPTRSSLKATNAPAYPALAGSSVVSGESSSSTMPSLVTSNPPSTVPSTETFIPQSLLSSWAFSGSEVTSTSISDSGQPTLTQTADPGTLADLEIIRGRHINIIVQGIDPDFVPNIPCW